MKNLLFLLIAIFLWSACKKSSDNSPDLDFDCVIHGDYLKTRASIELQIMGIWQLKKVSAMIPNPPVPNVSVIFLPASQVQIAKDDKLIYKGAYELKENISPIDTTYWVNIPSWNYQTMGDNYVRGTIRMCNTQLLIDDGMAADGPGYYYTKVGNF